MLHHCFSCGYSGTITMLYRDVAGEVPDNLEWELAKQSVTATLVPKEDESPEAPHVSEWSLTQYKDVPDALLERRYLQRSSVDRFGVRWDPDTHCWVLPIRDPEGELLGYQFRQKGSVINYPAGMEKSKTLFGANLFLNQNLERITVVESPLDAVRFDSIGISAVSSFGSVVSGTQVELLARNFRYITVAMDNDGPGIQSCFYLRRQLQKRGCVAIEFDYSGLAVKDPGDVQSDSELRKAWTSSNSLLIP
jgi:DNA primase